LKSYDREADLYYVEYLDGDSEDLSWVEFQKLLSKSGDTITSNAGVLGAEVSLESENVLLPYPDGTVVHRRMHDGIHSGKIVEYEPVTQIYQVLYDDGSNELVLPKKMQEMVVRTALGSLLTDGHLKYVLPCLFL
jgi:hypothetical protein